MKTLLCVLLDESGSMGEKRNDVIGGFNTFLKEQQGLTDDEARMILVQFNTVQCVVHGKPYPKDLTAVPPLNGTTYVPGGNTALLDAVAEGVRLADQHKDPDERVLCLVITDGEENSSKETTYKQVEDIIKEREGRGNWTFTYLGPDPSKWSHGGLATSVGNTTAYTGAVQAFRKMSASTTQYRTSTDTQTKTFYDKDKDKA
jgi:uncharacterized protein YegL